MMNGIISFLRHSLIGIVGQFDLHFMIDTAFCPVPFFRIHPIFLRSGQPIHISYTPLPCDILHRYYIALSARNQEYIRDNFIGFCRYRKCASYLFLSVAVLSLHVIHRHQPLLSEFADIYTVDQFAVRSIAKCTSASSSGTSNPFVKDASSDCVLRVSFLSTHLLLYSNMRKSL